MLNPDKATTYVFLLAFLPFFGCEKNASEITSENFISEEIGLTDSSDHWTPPGSAIFIDPSNSDAVEDGSVEHPYHTFANIKWKDSAVYVLKKGTTIETGTVVISTDNVTLASYGDGAKPIIKSTSQDHAVSTYWTGGSNITIRDIEIYAPDAVSCIIFKDNSTNAKVINCTLHGSTWGLRALNYIDNLYIFNTEIFDIKDDGMFIKNTDNIEVANCYIHKVNQNWVNSSTPESVAGGDGIQLENCNHWHIHHTYIDRSDNGNKFCFISNNPDQDDGIFEHNLLSGPKVNGFSIYIGDGTNLIIRYNYIIGPSNSPLYSHASGLKVYYNVFRDISGPLFASSSAEIYNNLFYHMSMGVQGGTIIARNNIFDLGSADLTRFKVSNLTEDHNLFVYGSATKNSIVGDPKYVDAANDDFHLEYGSDCIDNGIDIGFTEDIDGTNVPKSNAPDIGPYEFDQ
jgi:hypothetical protein